MSKKKYDPEEFAKKEFERELREANENEEDLEVVSESEYPLFDKVLQSLEDEDGEDD